MSLPNGILLPKEKNKFMKTFIYGLSTLAGTIIGVGIFALPYAASKVGILTLFFYFLILGALVVLIHLLFSEVTLRTEGQHRLPGYAKIYLGKGGEALAFFAAVLGLGGAVLAYLIVGGEFLQALFLPVFGGSPLFYTLIFFSLGAILIFFGIKSIAKVELFGLLLFFFILFLIFGRGFELIKIENLLNFEKSYLFLPYGLVLFSLWGAALVPEVREMLRGQEKNLKKLIFFSILISALTYLIFVFLVTGITGPKTSKEAIIGIKDFLGNTIVILALGFGILTCFTSFLTLGLTLKKVFWYDFGINRDLSWAIACFGPLILYFLGMKDFIKVIGLVGGVMLAIEGILIILMHLSSKTKGKILPAFEVALPKKLNYFLILILIFGIIYEIFYFIKG